MNDRLIIDRLYQEDCTLGVVRFGDFRCFSLENPWIDNEKIISCIPSGLYECEKYYSEKYSCECFRVLNVVGRTDISGHYGNYTVDTNGCLLFGDSIADINNDESPDVTNSKRTLSALIAVLPDKFQLLIK